MLPGPGAAVEGAMVLVPGSRAPRCPAGAPGSGDTGAAGRGLRSDRLRAPELQPRRVAVAPLPVPPHLSSDSLSPSPPGPGRLFRAPPEPRDLGRRDPRPERGTEAGGAGERAPAAPRDPLSFCFPLCRSG